MTTLELNVPQSWAIERFQPGQTVVKPWGRGAGKSWFDQTSLWMLVGMLDGKHRSELPEPFRRPCPGPLYGIRINVLCDTLAHFKEIHSAVIVAQLGEHGPWASLGARINQQSMGIKFPGGSEVRIFPALEHNAEKGRGARCDVVWIEETDDVPKSTYTAIALPWFSEPWSLKMTTVSGTPTKGRHGLLYELHQIGVDPDVPDVHSRVFTYRDAPETVDEQTVEAARRMMTPATFAREWECDFDAGEGLVYDVFDETLHIRKPPQGVVFTRFVVGTDWGYTDPHVFLVGGVSGHGDDAQIWILEEHYASGHTMDHWSAVARDISQRFGRRGDVTFFCDPSRPDSIKTIARATGRVAEGADNRIEDGISTVASRMIAKGPVNPETGKVDDDKRWARLYVAPGCENTLRELNEYRRKRDPRDRERFLETPEDKSNHAMDAMRYLCVGAFGMAPRLKHTWTAQESMVS